MRYKVWSATSVSVWQHVNLSEQNRPWDTLACCWAVRQPTSFVYISICMSLIWCVVSLFNCMCICMSLIWCVLSLSSSVSISVYHPHSTIICRSGLSCHFSADDFQLHSSSVPSDFLALACLWKIVLKMLLNGWVTASCRMNDDKTELFAIGLGQV